MRFRWKILLAVLLPSAFLVVITTVVAAARLSAESEEGARQVFERTRAGVNTVFDSRLRQLGGYGKTFSGPRFVALLKADPERIGREITYELGLHRYTPDFYCIRDEEDKAVLRYSRFHRCGPGCPHPPEEWLEKDEAFVGIDGEPFLAAVTPLKDDRGEVVGLFVFGVHARPDLDRLARDFGLELAAVSPSGGAPLYATRPGWAVPDREGDHVFDGVRYKVGRLDRGPASLVLVMHRSMESYDLRKRSLLLQGGAGLLVALVLAATAGALVARGVSRPVEALVEATRKVAAGDFGAKVDVRSRDEMGRLGGAFNDMTEGLRKRQEIMEKTLSRDVADELMKGVELGGERKDVTILFMDVRGFTRATEGVDPVEVVGMLNSMLDRLAGAIQRHGGNVNKYLGDGLMAMFGAPKPLDRHSLAACRAAIDMQREMAAWNAERSARGLASLQIGVGINAGVAVGGKVGSQERLEYTLIGEAVNLASRVCGKALPGQVLVTKSVAGEVQPEVRLKELEAVQVKGLSYAVQIFEVEA